MTLLIVTFGVCLVSALLPVVNAEAYLAGLSVLDQPEGLWLIAVVAAGGQTVGKIGYHLLGQRSLSWRWVHRRTKSPRWQSRLERWQARTGRNRGLAVLFVGGSAVTGFPPLAVLSVLAGQLGVALPLFAGICLVGRTLRFAVVLSALIGLL